MKLDYDASGFWTPGFSSGRAGIAAKMAENLARAIPFKRMRFLAAFCATAICDDMLTAERKRNNVLAGEVQAATAIYAAAKALECAIDRWLPHNAFKAPAARSIEILPSLRISRNRRIVFNGRFNRLW